MTTLDAFLKNLDTVQLCVDNFTINETKSMSREFGRNEGKQQEIEAFTE